MVFSHTRHKELWMWLADHPGKRKTDWPGWEEYGHVTNECFACETTRNFVRNCGEHCPLDWGTEGNGCCRNGSPYEDWVNILGSLYLGNVDGEKIEKRKEELRQLAIKIANLPVRDIDGLEVI